LPNSNRSRSIKAVFFDLEERGLIGSAAYVAKTRDAEKPAFAMNLDVFGYGETFFANASLADGPLVAAFQEAAKQYSISARLITSRFQYPGSDHHNLMAAGIETIGLSLIFGSEIDAIVERSVPKPRVLTIIHSPGDTLDKIRTADIEHAFPALEKAIRLIDMR
jgi:Zn-dependent M28 family amino/carboxypeptidase